MVVEIEILEQAKFIESRAVSILNSLSEENLRVSAQTYATIEKQAREVFMQARSLLWRKGSGIKRLPKLEAVKDLKEHLQAIQAASERVRHFSRELRGLSKEAAQASENNLSIIKKKALLYSQKKATKKAHKNAVSLLHTAKEVLEITQEEPWINSKDLALEENKEILVELLKGKGYYARFTQKERRALRDNVLKHILQDKEKKELDLSDTNLRGADLGGIQIKHIVRTETLEGEKNSLGFKGTISKEEKEIRQAPQINLTKCDLRETILSNSSFAAIFNEANLENQRIINSRFSGSGSGTNFKNAHFKDVAITCGPSANLIDADFINCAFSRCTFEGSDLSKTKFEKCNFKSTKFENVDLREVDLSSSVLGQGNFETNSFTLCDLNPKLLPKNLSRVNFTDISLEAEDLSDFNFSGCSFKNTSFNRSNLQRANFFGCDVRNLSIKDANLLEADFSRVWDLDEKQLTSAKNWWLADHLPNDFAKLVEGEKKRREAGGLALIEETQEEGNLSMSNEQEAPEDQEKRKGFFKRLIGK